MAEVPKGITALNPIPNLDNLYKPVGGLLWHQAYDQCLHLEREATMRNETKTRSLMHGRVLGNLLIYAPVDEGREHGARDIVEWDGDKEETGDLAAAGMKRFLQACELIAPAVMSCELTIGTLRLSTSVNP